MKRLASRRTPSCPSCGRLRCWEAAAALACQKPSRLPRGPSFAGKPPSPPPRCARARYPSLKFCRWHYASALLAYINYLRGAILYCLLAHGGESDVDQGVTVGQQQDQPLRRHLTHKGHYHLQASPSHNSKQTASCNRLDMDTCKDVFKGRGLQPALVIRLPVAASSAGNLCLLSFRWPFAEALTECRKCPGHNKLVLADPAEECQVHHQRFWKPSRMPMGSHSHGPALALQTWWSFRTWSACSLPNSLCQEL